MKRTAKHLNHLPDGKINNTGESSHSIINPNVLVFGVHNIFSKLLCIYIDYRSRHVAAFKSKEIQISDALIKNGHVRAVFISYELNNCKGAAFARAIKQFDPGIEIIGVSMRYSKLRVLRMLETGARAFITYDSPEEEIVHALESVLSHHYYFNDCLTESTLQYWLSTRDRADCYYKVMQSEIEIQIITYLYEGYTHEQIGVKMNKSKKRIDNIVGEMMFNTGSKNSRDLIRYSILDDLICPQHGGKEIKTEKNLNFENIVQDNRRIGT